MKSELKCNQARRRADVTGPDGVKNNTGIFPNETFQNGTLQETFPQPPESSLSKRYRIRNVLSVAPGAGSFVVASGGSFVSPGS